MLNKSKFPIGGCVIEMEPMASETNAKPQLNKNVTDDDLFTFFIIPYYIFLAFLSTKICETDDCPFNDVSQNLLLCLSPSFVTASLVLYLFQRSIPYYIYFKLQAALHVGGFYIKFLYCVILQFYNSTLNGMPASHTKDYKAFIILFHSAYLISFFYYLCDYCWLINRSIRHPRGCLGVYHDSKFLKKVATFGVLSFLSVTFLLNVMDFWYYWQPDWKFYEFFLWKHPDMDPFISTCILFYIFVWLPFLSKTKWWRDACDEFREELKNLPTEKEHPCPNCNCIKIKHN